MRAPALIPSGNSIRFDWRNRQVFGVYRVKRIRTDKIKEPE